MPPPPVPPLPASRTDFSRVVEPSVTRSSLPPRSVTLSEPQPAERSHYFSTVLNGSGDTSKSLTRRGTSIAISSDASITQSHGPAPITAQLAESSSLPLRTVEHSPLDMISAPSTSRTDDNHACLQTVTPGETITYTDTAPIVQDGSQPSSTTLTPPNASDVAPVTNQTGKSCSIILSSTNDRPSELLKDLENVPALYDLPPKDLEILVGQVVHEDGFVELVRSPISPRLSVNFTDPITLIVRKTRHPVENERPTWSQLTQNYYDGKRVDWRPPVRRARMPVRDYIIPAYVNENTLLNRLLRINKKSES